MRIDLLKLANSLMRIVAALSQIAEVVGGVIGEPSRGQRAGDAQLSQLASKLPLVGSSSPPPQPASSPPPQPAPAAPAPPPPPPGQPPPAQPIGEALQPGQVITR